MIEVYPLSLQITLNDFFGRIISEKFIRALILYEAELLIAY